MAIKWKHWKGWGSFFCVPRLTKQKKQNNFPVNITGVVVVVVFTPSSFWLFIIQRERESLQGRLLAGPSCPGCPSVPWSSVLPVFVHPRTVDIDCVGDGPRHISTPLAPATEKHINWLHWEPCLVTMAKHTGREEECWDGAAGSPRSLSGVVSHSFPFLQPCLSFSLSPLNRRLLFPSLSSLHTSTLFAYFFFSHILLIDADLINLPRPHTPPPYPTVQHCCLPFFLFSQHLTFHCHSSSQWRCANMTRTCINGTQYHNVNYIFYYSCSYVIQTFLLCFWWFQ